MTSFLVQLINSSSCYFLFMSASSLFLYISFTCLLSSSFLAILGLHFFLVLYFCAVNTKVKLSLCFFLTEHHAWRHIGEWGVAPRILDLGTRWRWLVSFTPRERAPGTHWIGGCVGPRASLDAVVKRKFSIPRRQSNTRTPNHPAHSQSLYRLSYHSSMLCRHAHVYHSDWKKYKGIVLYACCWFGSCSIPSYGIIPSWLIKAWFSHTRARKNNNTPPPHFAFSVPFQAIK
jgi:hypothetical protein